LQRDVAAAYDEAGFRVTGAAVAGDAACTLGEEAAIDARTVAKLLAELESGRDRLEARSVLMIDEAGTLGASQCEGAFWASASCRRAGAALGRHRAARER